MPTRRLTAAAAILSTNGILCDSKSSCQHYDVTRQTSSSDAGACDSNHSRLHRVLIVGAGLSGCLTASFLRRYWDSDDPLHITVLERATYPSGRFGAAAYHDDRWVADLGAQVLSVVDPDEEHQHVFDGGHGIDKAALLLAREEARD